MTAVQDLETAIGKHPRPWQSIEVRREETGLAQLVFEVGSRIHDLVGFRDPSVLRPGGFFAVAVKFLHCIERAIEQEGIKQKYKTALVKLPIGKFLYQLHHYTQTP